MAEAAASCEQLVTRSAPRGPRMRACRVLRCSHSAAADRTDSDSDMDTDDHSARPRAEIGRACANCGAPLATDQRYCVSCGTRRGPLPASVQSTLHEMRVPPAPVIEKLPSPPEPRPPFTLTLPTPRVAALAV